MTFPNERLWTLSRLLLGRKPIKVPDHFNSFTPKKMKKEIRFKPVKTLTLPFGMPFFMSLNCIIKFRK